MQMNLECFPIDNQVFVDNISSFSSPDAMSINVPHINFRESTNLFSFKFPFLQTPSSCIQLVNTVLRKYYLYEKF